MKHRKIGQELARDIASAIADKAFEHLLPQAQAECRAIADEAYDRIDAEFDFAKMAEYGFAYRASNGGTSKVIRIVADRDNYADLETSARPWGLSTYNCLHIEDAGMYARAREARQNRERLAVAHRQLRDELQSQLLGQTTKQAIEAWPEAAEIIADIAEVGTESPITKPLEALLARFIPALPAPQGV